MTVYLTVEDVQVIHQRLILETSGAWEVRDVNLLDSAIHRPQASFASLDL